MTALPAPDLDRPAPTRRPGTGSTRVRTGSRPRSTRTLTVATPLAEPRVARRAPFVLLVLTLVGAGLVALLVLNTAIAADSFTERALNRDIDRLQLQEQELLMAVAAAEAPAALAQAAVDLGMIPAGKPAFLVVHPDGTTEVLGAATPAARPVPPAGPAGTAPPAGTPDPVEPVDPADGGTG